MVNAKGDHVGPIPMECGMEGKAMMTIDGLIRFTTINTFPLEHNLYL